VKEAIMIKRLTALACALAALPTFAPSLVQAQSAALSFDRAAYITCRDAQAMAPEARVAVATFLAEHAARRRGARIPDGEAGAQLALLVRGGCTLYPDAYLLTVVDRAIVAELPNLPKR
jgi:hypothetical protein